MSGDTVVVHDVAGALVLVTNMTRHPHLSYGQIAVTPTHIPITKTNNIATTQTKSSSIDIV